MTEFEIKDGVAIIPDGTTKIPFRAFFKCKDLTTVVIPDSVTNIGPGAFAYCSSLGKIVIPDSVTRIVNGAFAGCSSLTSMVVAEGNTVYDSREQCNAIIHTATNTLICGCQNTIIPDNVTSIGDSAFAGCSSLTSIVIPDGVTSIGCNAFDGCSSLKQDLTQEIEMCNVKYRLLKHNHLAMVLGCSGRSETINIPSEINHEGVIYRVTSIGEDAFKNCCSLTSIVIPDSVTSIGEHAFSGCESLSSIVIPDSVTSIGPGAFSYCESLSSIVIPNSVTSIGDGAFARSYYLTSIVIPDSVTSIGDGAFAYCPYLTSITFNGTIEQWKKIILHEDWNDEVPINVIHCTDGDVEI